MDFLILDAETVKQQITALLADFPDLLDDCDLLADTLEGETNYLRVLDAIVEEIDEALSVKEAVRARRDKLKEREDRLTRKADKLRELAMSVLQASGLPRVKLPTATVSIRAGSQHVVFDDEAIIPQGYYRLEKHILKGDILAALKRGDEVPGAHIETGPASLSIRTA
jgi:hypothetical protein